LIIGYTTITPYGTYGPWFRRMTGGARYDFGTATVTGDDFEWDVYVGTGWSKADFGTYYLYPHGLATCSFDYYSTASAAYAAGNTVYGTLPCELNYVDTFTFEGAVGGTAYVTVDTTDEPALDPAMWVYGPEQCVEVYANESFPCTWGSSNCPALSIATDAAQYLLVVESSWFCSPHAGKPAGYRLDIDAAWDPKVTQIADDVDQFGTSLLDARGSATITRKKK
jgi:hypothetical protein